MEKKLDEVYTTKSYVVPHTPAQSKVSSLCVQILQTETRR
jgi:hypothetical protein